MKEYNVDDLEWTLNELGKGYSYCRRYHSEPLFGVLWSDTEGYFNFVLKVVHEVTGFNIMKRRISYYRNVMDELG